MESVCNCTAAELCHAILYRMAQKIWTSCAPELENSHIPHIAQQNLKRIRVLNPANVVNKLKKRVYNELLSTCTLYIKKKFLMFFVFFSKIICVFSATTPSSYNIKTDLL